MAFTDSPDRLREYAADDSHARFLTEELAPQLARRFPLLDRPQARCLMGASFGAVASFTAAFRAPGFWGRLLLQSGSFAFSAGLTYARRYRQFRQLPRPEKLLAAW